MTEHPTKNKVALKLEQAAKNSPYSLEKDNYQMAVDEIRRLQQLVDASHECQANRQDAAAYCEKCGRYLGEGCGKYGPYVREEIPPITTDDIGAHGDTHGGIFWVRATDGGWRSSTQGEACDEIKRLRAALKNISTGLAVIAHKPKPSAKPSHVEGKS
jgi:hypothetical protein